MSILKSKQNSISNPFSRGFTLVELLVVIAIIGILSTLLLLQLGLARGKARDAKRVSDIRQVQTAVEQYFDDNGGKYPTAITTAGAQISKYLSSGVTPIDPLSTNNYYYAYDAAASPIKYHLYAELEQYNSGALGSDADLDSSAWAAGDKFNASVPVIHAGTEACAAYVSGTSKQCVYDVGQK